MRHCSIWLACIIVLCVGSTEICAEGPTVFASWYGARFEGKLMKNGQLFRAADPTTAAHRTLPLGTKLLVKNPENGRQVVVVVKDRGPFTEDRDLDLSLAAAEQLGYVEKGVARVTMSVIRNP